MIVPTVIRLLGPRHRRLIDLDRNDPTSVRRLHALVALGWRVYTGPGVAVDGWLDPASDPRLAVAVGPATDVLGRMVAP